MSSKVGRGKIIPLFRSAFKNEDDGNTDLGTRPVVFDIISPDGETSVLPDGMKLVLHVNPRTMSPNYEKLVERIQTKGGWVEQHWGEGLRSISFEMATGGFKRLFGGLSEVTGGGYDTKSSRRETIAYDKFLDMLALFHNNGAIYDTEGEIAFQGLIKVTFEGGVYFGWFDNMTIDEKAETPHQFTITTSFTVSHEILTIRTVPLEAALRERESFIIPE